MPDQPEVTPVATAAVCGPCSVNDHMACFGCRCAYCADLRGTATAAPTPGVTVEYTYQVVADGDILNDFTKMDDALRYAVGLNSDWRRVEIVRITWEHIRVR